MINSTENEQDLQELTDEFKGLYLYDIPFKEKRELCQILEAQNVWEELASKMGYGPEDIRNFKITSVNSTNSIVEDLLLHWGEYNHNINELFQLLYLMQQFEAMVAIKHLVDPRLHKKITEIRDRPVERPTIPPKKILNRPMDTISIENNEFYGNDDNKQKSDVSIDANESAGAIPTIDYNDLRDATNNWCETHVLGKGGFATVFKGMWKNTPVAIKRIDNRGGGEKNKNYMRESLKELRCLNSCRHDNILPVYGYSINGKEPCLVYQLMAGGSLAKRLEENKNNKPLHWYTRIGISIGTARGLQFLHTCNAKPLIHGDIKPGNILLDGCCFPKIGDFGLAREGGCNDAMEVSKIYGTLPYLPVDFLGNRTLSTKVDTYSFGVVLLELATGLKACGKYGKETRIFLTKHIRNYAEEGNNLLDLIDNAPPIVPELSKIYLQLIKIAQACTDEKQENRPRMDEVLRQLKGEMAHYVPEEFLECQ